MYSALPAPIRGQVEAGQQGQLLEEHRALAPGLGLAHGQARVVEGQRGLHGRPPGGQVVVGQQPPVRPPGDVHHLGEVEVAGHVLGDETRVEDPARGLDLLVPVRAGRLGLVEQPLVGGGQLGVAEPGAGGRRRAAGQVHLGRAGPVLAEHPGHAGDRAADGRDDRVAAARVLDRVAQHVAEPGHAVVAQQQHPGPERARDAGGQQAVAGDQVEVERGECPRGGRLRRRPLAADHERFTLARVEADDRHFAAGPVQVRLDDLEHQPGRDRRVEGVAAPFQDGLTRGRGQPVGRGHHAVGAGQFRPGGELARSRHCAAAPF